MYLNFYFRFFFFDVLYSYNISEPLVTNLKRTSFLNLIKRLNFALCVFYKTFGQRQRKGETFVQDFAVRNGV